MFCLPNATACKILNVNPRDEKHGDEDVLAVDVKFSMTLLAKATADKIDAAFTRQAAAPSSTAEFYELYERSVL